MATGVIRIPAATQEDRRRGDLIKEHFIAWDMDSRMRISENQKSKHAVYDLAMGFWVGWVQLKRLISGAKEQGLTQSRQVSGQVMRSWGYRSAPEKEMMRSKVDTDLTAVYYGNDSS